MASRFPDSSTPFEEFWRNFPARNGVKAYKGQALRVWTQKKLDVKALEIMLALSVQVEHKKKCDREKVFCAEFPDAVRWLRHERWRDEVASHRRHEMLAHLSHVEQSPPGVVRRRELSGIVRQECPEMSPREVENEATRRWKAEGWEERNG